MSRPININSLFLAGSLTSDPVLKEVRGQHVAKFVVACQNRRKTIYVPCECWGQRGQQLARNLKKGDAIHFQGVLDLADALSSGTGSRAPKAVAEVKSWNTGGYVSQGRPRRRLAIAS
jgi:hypothetical protein